MARFAVSAERATMAPRAKLARLDTISPRPQGPLYARFAPPSAISAWNARPLITARDALWDMAAPSAIPVQPDTTELDAPSATLTISGTAANAVHAAQPSTPAAVLATLVQCARSAMRATCFHCRSAWPALTSVRSAYPAPIRSTAAFAQRDTPLLLARSAKQDTTLLPPRPSPAPSAPPSVPIACNAPTKLFVRCALRDGEEVPVLFAQPDTLASIVLTVPLGISLLLAFAHPAQRLVPTAPDAPMELPAPSAPLDSPVPPAVLVTWGTTELSATPASLDTS